MITDALSDTMRERRAVVRGLITAAARGISPHYPLEAFIARNPVADYEHLPFEQALDTIAAEHGAVLTVAEHEFRARYRAGAIAPADLRAAIEYHVVEARDRSTLSFGDSELTVCDLLVADLLHSPTLPSVRRSLLTPAELLAPRVHAQVDEQLGRWLSAAFGSSPWSPDFQRDGLWPTWRRLAGMDVRLPRRVRAGIRSTPLHPEDAVLDAVQNWGWTEQVAERYLRAHVLAQPGWSALVRHAASSGDDRVTMTTLIALRVTLESLLLNRTDVSTTALGYVAGAAPHGEPSPERQAAVAAALAIEIDAPEVRARLARVLGLVGEASRCLIWQEAFERGIARNLAPSVARVQGESRLDDMRPLAQAVFCIDPRSEGIRRHLERAGDVATLGFAGFFAVPIAYRSAEGGPPIASCPVLLTPRRVITESSFDRDPLVRWQGRLSAEHSARSAGTGIKQSPLAAFAFAETAGWLEGPAMTARTLTPSSWRSVWRAIGRLFPQKPATRLDADVAMDSDERTLYADAALRMMGLVGGFARIVLLCGHGATVTNNPYSSALQCGACGGHEGAPNARAAAMIFNDPVTRARLVAHGISIPDDTLFVAAQHDTVTDEVRLLEPWAIPATHENEVTALMQLLGTARDENVRERLATLPGAHSLRAAERRAADWAEVYPEWGLVRNAAFIVGPRSITAGRDLARRVFLHSYDPAADPDATALETILTAPMIVAQWINAQYTASTTAPDRFGAGPKPLHNIVGTVGVLSGYAGDLRIGLPWQSVGIGEKLVHEPARLQVFVQAPLARINTIVDNAEIVRTLVENEWIVLRAREHATEQWLRYGRYGWQQEPGLTEPEVVTDPTYPQVQSLEVSP